METVQKRRSLRQAAVLVLALMCAYCHEAGHRQSEPAAPLRTRLIKVLGPARLSSGRLVGFSHAPLGSTFLLPAKAAFHFRRESQGSSAEELALSALLNLALHGPVSVSIAKLEKAREQAPENGRLACDLSALYLDEGLGKDRPEALFLALRSAEAACRLAPRLPEARFNLALALEGLFLDDAARKAFTDYLALDPASGWSEEARAHLSHLSKPQRATLWKARKNAVDSAAADGDGGRVRDLITGFFQHARLHLEQELLPRWAAGQSSGADVEAGKDLRASRLIAAQLTTLTGDSMLDESVAAIDRAAREPDLRAALVEGHRVYAEANQLYTDYQTNAAARSFTRAEITLKEGGSPLHLWASLFLAACDYQRHRYEPALRRLETLEAEPAILRYPVLLGRTRWLRGLIEFITGRLFTARKSYEAALVEFQRAGETGYQAAVEYLLFETYDVFGEEKEAYRHLHRALRGADEILESRRKQLIARSAAELMLRSPEPRTALYFEDESVHWAMSSGNPVQIAQALHDQARSSHVAGDQELAIRKIADARTYARQVGDDGITADVLVAEAEILESERPAAALADLSVALPLLVKTRYNETLAALYLLRARLHIKSGARDLAAADLRAGIEQLELTSAGLDDGSRLHYLERSSALFDEMIALAAASEAGEKAEAFHYAERGRGRALATLMGENGAGSVQALRLGEVSGGLPAGVALVEFAVLPKQVLAWVVTAEKTRALVLPLSAGELTSAVRHLRVGIAGRSTFKQPSTSLYQSLIAPLSVAPGVKLVIVPDKVLYQVPFAALRDAKTGRYLIEEHSLEMAPSASVYLHCQAQARSRRAARRTAPSVLIIADPAFDRSLAPILPRLPGAAAEAIRIARLYGQSDLLTGAEATSSRFLQGIGNHNIVHFSGHAQVDGPSPLLARLFLAPQGRDSGVLFARDLYGRQFAETELVFLSACNTAAGQVSESEGVSSLARPFLAAGVPGVVASQWEIDDSATASFSSKFHHLIGSGEDAAEALRGAVLELLRSRSPELAAPRTWATFVLFGTGTTQKKGAAWLLR